MLTTKREDLPEVTLVKNERTGGYLATVVLPARHDDGHQVDVLPLNIIKGTPNGEFGMTTPGRWYITSRLSHYAPTGRGREGYPTKAAAILHIEQWLANPDNGETWS